MHVHIACRGKSFVTFVTLKWFLTSMSVVMFFEALACGKPFTTALKCARKGLVFVLGMENAHMDFQAHFLNHFAANCAITLFMFMPYVHGQIRFVRGLETTLVTLILHLTFDTFGTAYMNS